MANHYGARLADRGLLLAMAGVVTTVLFAFSLRGRLYRRRAFHLGWAFSLAPGRKANQPAR